MGTILHVIAKSFLLVPLKSLETPKLLFYFFKSSYLSHFRGKTAKLFLLKVFNISTLFWQSDLTIFYFLQTSYLRQIYYKIIPHI